MIKDEFLTYDELLADPPEWARVSQHAAFAQNGVLVVYLPGLDGIAIKPGQQLNYQTNEEGHVVAYSLGRAEEKAPSTPAPASTSTPEDAPPASDGDGAPASESTGTDPGTSTSAEPEPAPSPEPAAETPEATVADAIEKADEHLAKKAAAKPAVGRKGATK